MLYAVDRFAPGKEIEVAASDFYNTYIPKKNTRFFCPECGEQVFWRSRSETGNRVTPDVFYHKNKTDSSPECDKRVDGNSGLGLSQRVGLSLYLSRNSQNAFYLNISFPRLGASLFDRICSEKAFVKISAGSSREKRLPINRTNFYSDSSTLIPIDFVPDHGNNYTISVSSTQARQLWPDFADGFSSNGGIFAFSDAGGKKIRRGDSIQIGKPYYLVSKGFSPFLSEVKVSKIGSIDLNNQSYGVYSLIVDVNTSNEYKFYTVDSYINRSFGVRLIEKTPSIIPLWPPVVEKDTFIPIKKSSRLHCLVDSDIDDSQVYSYIGHTVSTIPTFSTNDAVLVNIPITSFGSAVSVNRKYTGREIFISPPVSPEPKYSSELSFTDNNGNTIDPSLLSSKMFSSEISIMSNQKIEIYSESADKTYQHVRVRNSKTSIPPRRNIVALHVVFEDFIKSTINFYVQTPKRSRTKSFAFKDLSPHCHGSLLPIPLRLIETINGSPEIQQYVKHGKLPRGIIEFIFKNEDC